MDANTEDYLEILYWEFDSEKKKFSFSERDLFKAKMRGLIRTIQNTSATDQLLEKMALVATHLLANPAGTEEWQELAGVLKEYQERKYANK